MRLTQNERMSLTECREQLKVTETSVPASVQNIDLFREKDRLFVINQLDHRAPCTQIPCMESLLL